ncbi:disks large-associated protein 5 [Fopius arisanus]|uniref:Disks large-associated protein 5 n=2 Tax=Fopius arisanus TaxID=64838 RepID=A0A9R1T4T7_9HYME|nr:PREDICTED: disks large-associated protein 5 [Fopius arisanus]
MDRRDQWKSKPRNFQSKEARYMRMDEHQSQRQNRREQQLNRLRQISPVSSIEEEIEDTPEYRAIRLEKWKVQKDLKKKLEAKKKRPAFVIGIPHHNFFSPASKGSVPHQHKKPRGSTPPKRVTAVTARRMAARQAAAAATATGASNSSTIISQPSTSTGKTSASKSPLQPRLTRSRKKALLQAEKKSENRVEKETLKKISLAPENYEFKGPKFSRPMPLFGEVIIPDVVATLDFKVADYSITTKIQISPLKPTQEMTEKTPPKRDKSPPAEKIPQTTSLEKVSEEEPEAVVKQISSQSCNSSIESVILRMSSQFEASIPPQEVNILEEQKSIDIELSSEEVMPAQFSPFIVSSRGKSNARKEQKQRLSLHKSSPKDDVPTKDTVIQSLNISVAEEKNTSQYYKHLVNSEEARLNELCSTWQPLQEDSITPEDGIYMINQAIGQTKLLIRKKFERFKCLVNSCETGMGEQLVRCADLQGFWEMMQMEIRDCDSRFTKLAEIRGNGWKEEEEVEMKVQKKRPVVKKKKIEGRSNMRSFIEAQRKKRMAKENVRVENIPEVKESIDVKSSLSPRKSLPRPVSPHSRAKLTPRGERLSLLKQVQLTESAKRLTQNSFAMIKVTQKCKTPEIQHDQSISYINSGQTPGKGILKKTENLPRTDGKQDRQTCKVNFNDVVDMPDQIPLEEGQVFANKKLVFDDDDIVDDSKHTVENDVESSGYEPGVPEGGTEDHMPPPAYIKETKKIPGIRVPTIELTEATPILQPTDTSKEITPPINRVPTIEMIEATPLSQPKETSEETTPSPGKTTPTSTSDFAPESLETSGIQQIIEDPERKSETSPGSLAIRQLRNRTILIDNLPVRKRRTSRLNASMHSSFGEEGNMSNDFGNKENSSGVQNVKLPSPRTPKVRINLDKSSVRRSARKSVKHLPDDDCITCKPVPLTPRRLKDRISFFGNRDVVADALPNGDLMAFDSPRS